jgi:5'-3' exonuclease
MVEQAPGVEVHLLDGTYELFRYYYGQPSHVAGDGHEVGAVRGVVGTIVSMLESGVTHLGVATDHTVESFRNALYEGYKTGDGVPGELLFQFALLEEAVVSLGVTLWPMEEYEADDGLASAARRAAEDGGVSRVYVCSPDKDLAQCVVGDRVLQRHRRTDVDLNEAAVIAHFGVAPHSIPDWLALVGDSADGFPGLKGWGKKGAATVLRHYGHLEAIPAAVVEWEPSVRAGVRGAQVLAERLAQEMDQALLFRDLATLRTNVPTFESLDDLRWSGPSEAFHEFAIYLGARRTLDRIERMNR